MSDSMTEDLLAGPIADVHAELGASFASFGGWNMPVSYGGTVGEHNAVRSAVGLFDVSHLGKALIVGPGAAEFVNSMLTNDLGRIHPGKAQYTLCCNAEGGVIDDIIAYLVSDDEVFLVPNASNTTEVVAVLQSHAPEGITVTNQHRDYGVFAVQGPKSTEVLQALGLPTDMEYMAFADAELNGYPVRVCRTGYTGEHGYEVLPAWNDCEPVFRALLREVVAREGQPAGLGARDTLRTEMGYPLHGHELSPTISPVQAGAGWAVGWKKGAFLGRDALVAERAEGPKRRLYGLKVDGRGIPRDGQTVLSDGEVVGRVTSGTFSPTLKAGIALALIDTDRGIELGSPVEVDVRGRMVEATVVKPPFVAASTG